MVTNNFVNYEALHSCRTYLKADKKDLGARARAVAFLGCSLPAYLQESSMYAFGVSCFSTGSSRRKNEAGV